MKRMKKFDDGGLASSGPQSAFSQQSNPYPSASGGLGNYAPLVQIGATQGQPTTPNLNLTQPQTQPQAQQPQPMKRGGKVRMKANCYAKGGVVKSGRGDGCAQRGKTKGRMV